MRFHDAVPLGKKQFEKEPQHNRQPMLAPDDNQSTSLRLASIGNLRRRN